MPRRALEWLYIRESLSVSIPESELGSGKTLTAKFSATAEGDPADIGSLTETATASASAYSVEFTRADLVTDLATAYVGRRVYLHLDDGAAWHDVWPYKVTDTDPSLLEPPV